MPTPQIDPDDECPICRLLICRPVLTGCNHSLCKSCFATWADSSVAATLTIVDIADAAVPFDAATGVKAACPMCRTQTSAAPDPAREVSLRRTYAAAYLEREAEEVEAEAQGASVLTLTLCIGNRHRLEPGAEDDNVHDWDFFVRPDRTDVIEEVRIHLHPTFRPEVVVRRRPPYEVQRSGWGVFELEAVVVLREGYSWVSSDAEAAFQAAQGNGLLRLKWMLDFEGFEGRGSMGRCRLKVRNELGTRRSTRRRRAA